MRQRRAERSWGTRSGRLPNSSMNDPTDNARIHDNGPGARAGDGRAGIGRTPLRIGIDVRALWMPGIGRHVRELVTAIAEANTIDRFFLYCDNRSAAASFNDRWPHVRAVLIGSRLYSVGEQWRLPLRIVRDRLDLF